MSRGVTIEAALRDKHLLGAALGDASSWERWIAVLKAAFALPLTSEEAEVFAHVSGGRAVPSAPVRELWAVAGRRSGKTRMAAALAVFLAVLWREWRKECLAVGETGYVLLMASTRDQARALQGYIRGFILESPILKTMFESETASEIRLKGDIVIMIHPANFRSVRGRTLVAALCDEVSVWREDGSGNPDVEVYRAIKPALMTTQGMLIGISSPRMKAGLLYNKHRDHFGRDDDHTLVIQAASRYLNPALDEDEVAREIAADPEAASEWDATWREAISSLLDDVTIDAAIDEERPLEIPPAPGIRRTAFIDASGGKHDAYTVCIGHAQDDRFVCDVIRGRASPFDPQAVTKEFVELAKEYGCTKVIGDAYSGIWLSDAVRESGLPYETSSMHKSRLYIEALPHFMRHAVEIPNDPILIRELRLLERRVNRSGKDSVDHPRRGSDDYANALVGCLVHATSGPKPLPEDADFSSIGSRVTSSHDSPWSNGASREIASAFDLVEEHARNTEKFPWF